MTKKGKHTVLFICLGNICRSPAGEGIMKSLVEKAGLQDEFEYLSPPKLVGKDKKGSDK